MGPFAEFSILVTRLAARQHGHVARSQLLDHGVPPARIARWVRDGRLVSVHAGVYAVGYRRVEPLALAGAAVLACGPGAVLSHGSAAALWELGRWPTVPEVTVSGDRRPHGVRVHRSRTLTAARTTTQLGIRTTTAERTLRDIRRRHPPRHFARLVNRARLDHHLSLDAAERLLGATTRSPTRSGHEDALLRWLTGEGLAGGVLVNAVSPAGHEVDAYYPRQGVILEMDAYATHGDPATFSADRERDGAHAALGLVTVRLELHRLTPGEAARLRAILRRRRPDLGPTDV